MTFEGSVPLWSLIGLIMKFPGTTFQSFSAMQELDEILVYVGMSKKESLYYIIINYGFVLFIANGILWNVFVCNFL